MTVSLEKCTTYCSEEIKDVLVKLLNPLGGMETFVKPGQRVALKVNLVMAKRPEEAATTHPEVVKAVAEEVLRVGGIPFIIDSPGGPFYNEKGMRHIYRKTGMEAVATELGIELNWDFSEQKVLREENLLVKSLTLIKPLLEADVIINLPKLKTHSMTTYSGAVKNLYGSVAGMKKAEYHFRMPKEEDFSNVLVDICETVRPHLHILDGIIGMEGEGPTAGEPKTRGLLLASECPYQLDWLATQLIGLKPLQIMHLNKADQRGLLKDKPTVPSGISAEKFRVPTSKSINFVEQWLPNFLSKHVTKFLQPNLQFSPELCVGCGHCFEACPAKALEMREKLPQLEEDKCIRCYCCQELCPQKAVLVRQNWLTEKLFR